MEIDSCFYTDFIFSTETPKSIISFKILCVIMSSGTFDKIDILLRKCRLRLKPKKSGKKTGIFRVFPKKSKVGLSEINKRYAYFRENYLGVVDQCKTCDKIKKNLKQCCGCKFTHYCSILCQSVDWYEHKPVCKFFRNLNSVK